MKVLLKNAKIISPESSYYNTRQDILIEEGQIKAVGKIDEVNLDIITSDDLHVSIGWFDIGARLGDPGFEHKEDLQSGLEAAVCGGFTDVACLPNTKPAIQNKENIIYLLSKAKESPVALHVLAAATENLEGKSMTEVFDLHNAGAVGFSDGGHIISDSGLLVRLLQYMAQIDAVLLLRSDDRSLSSSGVMNEGITSVFLGQKGIPSISEEIATAKNLALLEYAGGKMHINKVSTAACVELIRNAKKKGIKVSCDVSVANLVYDESLLVGFDTNFKVTPPLRTVSDQKALWEGVLDGTIDLIITDHDPQDEESKKLEFDLAENGMIQFETAFALLNAKVGEGIPLETIVTKITKAPRSLLGLPIPTIEVGAQACITAFDPSLKWTYTSNSIRSKSKNSPEIGSLLTGKPLAIFNKGKFLDLRKRI